MKDQIKEILQRKNLTSAQFADLIGVQRSSISHILSGRNKPGFDFIQKIILSYPDINAEWLITGEGTMFKGKESEGDLFEPETRNIPLQGSKAEARPVQRDPEDRKREIEKILVFYSDHSFGEYHPESE